MSNLDKCIKNCCFLCICHGYIFIIVFLSLYKILQKLLSSKIIILVYFSFRLLLPRKSTVMHRIWSDSHTATMAAKLPRLNVSRSSAKSQFRFCRTLFAQSTSGLYSLAVFWARGDLSTNHEVNRTGDQRRGATWHERARERESQN